MLVFAGATEKERSELVAATVQYWREKGIFEVLKGWRDELYPVYGNEDELLWSVERSASPLFGILVGFDFVSFYLFNIPTISFPSTPFPCLLYYIYLYTCLVKYAHIIHKLLYKYYLSNTSTHFQKNGSPT